MAIAALPTKKRIFLSGTPIQNALDEFYSMVRYECTIIRMYI